MAEKRLTDTDDSRDSRPAASPLLFANRREWAAALAFPWFLAVALLLSYGGEDVPGSVPLGRVLCAATVLVALVCATVRGDGTRPAIRSVRLALALALLGVPVLGGVMAATELRFWMIPASTVLLFGVSFALVQMAYVLGDSYSVAVAAWFAGPPFVYYLLLEMFAVKAPALLYVSPASGAVFASRTGSVVLGSLGAAVVPVFVGIGLSIGGRGRRAVEADGHQ